MKAALIWLALTLALAVSALLFYYQIEDRWEKCEARGGNWNSEIPACSDGKGLHKWL